MNEGATAGLTIGLRKTVFNATMRDARKAKGLTLVGLAQLVFGSKVQNGSSTMGTRIGGYERMATVPAPGVAQEIADALEVRLDDIFPEVLRQMPRARPQELRVPVAQMQLPGGEHPELAEVLGTLTTREQKILGLRFGLEDGIGGTREEIGRMFGITASRVQQIEAKALRKLRHPSRIDKLREVI